MVCIKVGFEQHAHRHAIRHQAKVSQGTWLHFPHSQVTTHGSHGVRRNLTWKSTDIALLLCNFISATSRDFFSGLQFSYWVGDSDAVIFHRTESYWKLSLNGDRWVCTEWKSWNVNDSAITVIMIRRGLRDTALFSTPCLPSAVWTSISTREMAPFRPVAARIHALQNLVNQLQYNRRECQQLVDHINAFIASLKEKSHAQNLLDLQRKLLQ